MSTNLDRTLLCALHNTADVFCRELKVKKPIFIRLFSLDVPPLEHLKPSVQFDDGVSTDMHLATTYHADLVTPELGSPIAFYVSQLYKLLSERITLTYTLDYLKYGIDIGLLMHSVHDKHRPLFDVIVNGNHELEVQWCALFDRREHYETYKEVPKVNAAFQNIPNKPLIDWEHFSNIARFSYYYDSDNKTIVLVNNSIDTDSNEYYAVESVLVFCRKHIRLLEGARIGNYSPAELLNELTNAKSASGASLTFPFAVEYFHPDTAEYFLSEWHTKMEASRVLDHLTGKITLTDPTEALLIDGFLSDLSAVVTEHLSKPTSVDLTRTHWLFKAQQLEALGDLPDRDYNFAAMFGFKTFFADQPQELTVTTKTFVPLDEDNTRTAGEVVATEGEQVVRANFDGDGRMSIAPEILPIAKVLSSYGLGDVNQTIDYIAIINNRAEVLMTQLGELTDKKVAFPNNFSNPWDKVNAASQFTRINNMRLAYDCTAVSHFIASDIGCFWTYSKSVDVSLDNVGVTAKRLFLIYRDWVLYQFIAKTFDCDHPDVTIKKIASFV